MATAPSQRCDGEGAQARRMARRALALLALAVDADQQPDAERDQEAENEGMEEHGAMVVAAIIPIAAGSVTQA